MFALGNNSRPGTVVICEIDHEPVELLGARYFVRELVWNGINGRSYDLVRDANDEVLTDESFGHYPSLEEIRDTITEVESLEMVACRFCQQHAPLRSAHRHAGAWVGDPCCWDERLRATE